MTVNLDQTLSWTRSLAADHPQAAAELAMLHDLQGNILKGHGRDSTVNFFLAFSRTNASAGRDFVEGISHLVTTALDQLIDTQTYKATGADGGPFVAFMLAAEGYRALARENAMPRDVAFLAGMRSRDLKDPPVEQWDAHLSACVHAMIIIGSNSTDELAQLRSRIECQISDADGAVCLLGVEDGIARRNRDKNGIENFGYVDGRSQPLALQEDVDQENRYGGTDQWDPSIPLRQLLVRCPGGTLAVSHGSYFVFRKLEQNVRDFMRREDNLAEALGIGERAGASVVGRFENGTPVTLHEFERTPIPEGTAGVPNNFNYLADGGLKCPFAAHIRKANPRSDTPYSKSHLMARRGILYGNRSDDPNDGEIDNKPTGGVGLLFMAYQSDFVDQFEFTQRTWANNINFPQPDIGIDPVIGQPGGAGGQQYPREYGVSLGDRFDFSGFVTMRGGEYFFAPSISFLKAIAD
jgi:Dyp-type peroxidase family